MEPTEKYVNQKTHPQKHLYRAPGPFSYCDGTGKTGWVDVDIKDVPTSWCGRKATIAGRRAGTCFAA